MKIVHRVPIRPLVSDPITPEYQREVDRSTEKLEREYAAAQRRLEAAQRRAEKAQELLDASKRATGGKKVRVKADRLVVLWAEVEYRRGELAKIAALMMPAGASTQHRGRDSYRPVPITHSGL